MTCTVDYIRRADHLFSVATHTTSSRLRPWTATAEEADIEAEVDVREEVSRKQKWKPSLGQPLGTLAHLPAALSAIASLCFLLLEVFTVVFDIHLWNIIGR